MATNPLVLQAFDRGHALLRTQTCFEAIQWRNLAGLGNCAARPLQGGREHEEKC